MEEGNKKKADIQALFKGQSERAFVFGKLEKLSHAVILLTSQSDTERAIVGRLEASVLDSVREAAILATNADHSALASILLELVSLVRLSATAGVMTESNSTILVEEYLGVLGRLAAPSLQGIVLRRDELLLGENEEGTSEQSLWPQLPSPIDDLFSSRGNTNEQRSQGQTKYDKGRPEIKKRPTESRLQKQTNVGESKGHTDGRSQAIVSIVRAKGNVSIRDISAVITDCSEKTIQRELLDLVRRGVLRKEGERRWSTYRLA